MRSKPINPKKSGHGSIFKKDTLLMYGLMAPSLIIVFAMSIVPLIYTLLLSIQNYSLIKPQDATFAGLSNYTAVFTDEAARQSVITTFIYTFSSVVLSLFVGILLAIIVNNVPKGKTFLRIALFTPMMLSAVVIGVIWRFLLNYELGVVNYLLELVAGIRINWLGSGNIAMTSVIIADVWQWSSYTFILVLASLEAMNPEPVEAACIDGANAFQIFRLVKLPVLLPVIEVAAVFRFIWAFRGFDLIYALTKGGPGSATETMSLEIWKQAFTRYDVGLSSAIAMIMFILLILLSTGILRRTMLESRKESGA